MQLGSYTAKAFGYSMGEPVEVTVTVTKNKITDIYVNPDNAETEPVFNAALAVADRTAIADIDDVMQAGIKAGFIYKTNSIRALATVLKIDHATLSETINTFNGYCANGVDSEFIKTIEKRSPFDEASNLLGQSYSLNSY